eukprot:SAG31_NODE_46900_length_252_cov_1.006536_1_plen_51_part_01
MQLAVALPLAQPWGAAWGAVVGILVLVRRTWLLFGHPVMVRGHAINTKVDM